VKVYRYVGPEHIRAAAATAPAGVPIRSRADLAAFPDHEATYVVGTDGTLRIAPRRSEHVACAGGGGVLAAGELFLDGDRVAEASNLSTGYCPEPSCWAALAAALDAAGIARPNALTYAFDFRRCTACGERNLVKDGDYTCAVCGADLPASWNF
jgi:DNA-directed RNA polymerase subunit RPC12/RpoP